MPTPRNLLLRCSEIDAAQERFSHPWNPRSEITGTHLSRLTGLKDTGVSRVTIPPRRESFVYHLHHREEEWIYILSGRGVAEINEEEFEVEPGDFMGFPAGNTAHHLRNPHTEPLTYLMGGSNKEIEIADFPRLGRRMIRDGEDITTCAMTDLKPFGPLDPVESE